MSDTWARHIYDRTTGLNVSTHVREKLPSRCEMRKAARSLCVQMKWLLASGVVHISDSVNVFQRPPF